jgi:hypothetical protein
VSRSGFESLAAHHAGVTGILAYLASSDLAACAFESHLPHSVRDRSMEGFQALNLAMLVRPQLPEPCLCSSPGQSAAPVRRSSPFETDQRLHARGGTVYALA